MNATTILPQQEHILTSDNVSRSMRYANGSVATLLYYSTRFPDFPKEYMELYADGKVLVMDDYRVLRVHGTPARICFSRAR